MQRFLSVAAVFVIGATGAAPRYDLDALPDVENGFAVNLFAQEPDLMHPGAFAFDRRGAVRPAGR